MLAVQGHFVPSGGTYSYRAPQCTDQPAVIRYQGSQYEAENVNMHPWHKRAAVTTYATTLFS
eukprot:5340884-Pleurochrysis_carterae.AAC.1